MSSAVIASTTVSELRLMFCALARLCRTPVTTISSRSVSGGATSTASVLPDVPLVEDAEPCAVWPVPVSAPAVPENVPLDPEPAGLAGST